MRCTVHDLPTNAPYPPLSTRHESGNADGLVRRLARCKRAGTHVGRRSRADLSFRQRVFYGL